jgi:anti-anti-sigma factor
MDFTHARLDDGILLLRLAGRMDIEGSGQVELRLTAATAGNNAHVIVDLTDVTFMASIGIGVRIQLTRAVRRRGGELALVNPQPIVKMVLDRTGVRDVMRMFGTVDEAAASLRASHPRGRLARFGPPDPECDGIRRRRLRAFRDARPNAEPISVDGPR